MPLIAGKSRKSFEKNFKTEMGAGKPKDQSLAIAYSIKRKNSKKMAMGGEVTAKDEDRPMPGQSYNDSQDVSMNSGRKSLGKSQWDDDTSSDQASRSFSDPQSSVEDNFADDREASADSASTMEDMNMRKSPSSDPMGIDMDHDEDIKDARLMADGGEVGDHYESIADAILAKKRKAKMMAEGGMVDLDANSEEGANMADSYNEDALLKEQYDDGQLSHQPEDSNEEGDSREMDSENVHDQDMVSSIRKRMKSKRS